MTPLAHWRVPRPAFENALDPGLFFPSEDHSEALARLEYLSAQPGAQLGLLTGDVGCGKSLTRAVFAARSAGRRAVAQLSSSHYPFRDLLRGLLQQLGQADAGATATEFDLVQALRRAVDRAGRPVVLVLDEAQELDREAMVGLRAINNLADGALDLTVVLVGQPELRERVQALPQLDQRAGLRYHLRPLAAAEVGAYLVFRLRAAGHPDGELFAPPAAEEVARRSAGVPREINRLARLALAVAAARGAEAVEAADVATVASDLEEQRSGAVG